MYNNRNRNLTSSEKNKTKNLTIRKNKKDIFFHNKNVIDVMVIAIKNTFSYVRFYCHSFKKKLKTVITFHETEVSSLIKTVT